MVETNRSWRPSCPMNFTNILLSKMRVFRLPFGVGDFDDWLDRFNRLTTCDRRNCCSDNALCYRPRQTSRRCRPTRPDKCRPSMLGVCCVMVHWGVASEAQSAGVVWLDDRYLRSANHTNSARTAKPKSNFAAENSWIIIIIIIYSLKIGAGQQGRICGTYSCPQNKITCRNIK